MHSKTRNKTVSKEGFWNSTNRGNPVYTSQIFDRSGRSMGFVGWELKTQRAPELDTNGYENYYLMGVNKSSPPKHSRYAVRKYLRGQ